MKPPKTVWILGLPVTLVVMDRLVAPDGEQVRGLYDSTHRTISVEKDQADMALTFWHESLHAGFDCLCSQANPAMNSETACDVQAATRESIERDPRNKRLMAWLKEIA